MYLKDFQIDHGLTDQKLVVWNCGQLNHDHLLGFPFVYE